MHQKYPVESIPHTPRYYICGVFVPQKQEWIGQFAATAEDLMEYGNEAGLNGREFDLIYNMITTQGVYEDWWESIKKDTH